MDAARAVDAAVVLPGQLLGRGVARVMDNRLEQREVHRRYPAAALGQRRHGTRFAVAQDPAQERPGIQGEPLGHRSV